MDAQASATKSRRPEREWWLRLLVVFQSPKTVFTAMRSDSPEQADARQEPVLALVILAAVAAVLASPTTRELLDNPRRDGALVAVLIFLTAGMYGLATYWIGGGVLHLGLRGAGARSTYRRARHLLAFAAAPLALSLLVVWPIELAVFGGDYFRTGGNDSGTALRVFEAIHAGFFLWAFVLLVYGVRLVHRWSIARSLGAIGLAVLALVALSFVPIWVSVGGR